MTHMVFNNIDALLSSIKSKWTVDGNKEKIKKQLRAKKTAFNPVD